MTLLRRIAVITAAATAALTLVAAASGNVIASDNWAGYAAHGSGVHIRHVTGTWRQPSGLCPEGENTYSAFWVGIGGYSRTSQALEQIGTELDCLAKGKAQMSAWYELVPASSRSIRMTVDGGDLMTASVTISGRKVTVAIADTTRHESFRRTIVDHTIDNTSAEWIAEAPSECTTSRCTTLPLADFDGIDFSGATATTTAGVTRPVSSSLWGTTELMLGYTSSGGTLTASKDSPQGTPTALTEDDEAFRVNYSGAAGTTSTTGTTGSGSTGTGSGTTGTGSGTPGTGSGTTGTGTAGTPTAGTGPDGTGAAPDGSGPGEFGGGGGTGTGTPAGAGGFGGSPGGF